MTIQFYAYSFFAPEFVESQRQSFLKLLDTGIPTEIEKYNPIELNIQKKQYQSNTGLENQIPPIFEPNLSNLELETTSIPILKSNRVRVNRPSESQLFVLKDYLTPKNQFLPITKSEDRAKAYFHSDQNIHSTHKMANLNCFQKENNLNLQNRYKSKIRGKTNYFLTNKTLTPICEKPYTVLLYPKYYKLIPPAETSTTALLNSKTYSAPIYIPAELKNPTNKIILSQWLLLGNLPIMTNRGHFIINGTPRVILHQFVRSPGVYYHQAKNKKSYYADIICHRGVWLRIELDKKGLIWLRMKNSPKLPMISFLQAFGLEHPHLLSQLEHEILKPADLTELISNGIESKLETLGHQIFRYSKEARFLFELLIIDSRGRFRRGYINHLKLTKEFFKSKLSPQVYDLSHLGRTQLNRKFGLNQNQTTLTADDFICILNYLILVKNGRLPVDDIDHLKNRRARCSGELIQNQFGIGLSGIQKLANREKQWNDFLKVKTIKRVVNTKPINGSLKEFFNSNPLSQFLDQTNALAEITHKRRLSSLGPGGITRETAGMKIRSIHPSHYGRICPIETPEGPNAGLVNSPTTYSRINQYGFLETPFFKVYNGQIQNDQQLFYLTANQDEFKAIAPPDLKLKSFACLKANTTPIRIGSEFVKTSQQNVDFMSISRIQMISIATSLIPFLEHNDANRALMGSNMQRQSVPLINPERPIVGTGLEGRVISDSGYTIEARESGLVTYISGNKIQVFSFFQTKVNSQFFKSKNKTIFGATPSNNFEAGIITYYLQKFTRSNQNTCFVQRPLVTEGQWVQKGECLTDCTSSAFGELAIGKNILVGYLPWEGYNFEDAILVSERLIFDDLFTSVHIVRYSTEVRETKFGLEEITRKQFDEPKYNFKHLDSNGIVKLGSWVSEGDILVRKVTPIGKQQMTPYQKFLYVVVDKPLPVIKDVSLRVPKGLEGRVVDIKIRKSRNTVFASSSGPEAVFIWIAEKKWLQVGDKMAGRHGNKGIVSRILPRQDMPYLPDGTPLDMVLNPLGVPSRMNVGQLFETLLGLAGKQLNQNYKVTPFDEITGPEASRSLTFSKLYEARQKTGKDWLFQPQHPGKVNLFDGRTGEPFDQSITIGQSYMLKLIHLVDEKIHARATGPYSLVTQQPLRGRSKHGGQRFGEMEVWAFEGFGAAYTLQEILTVKSDDIQGRQQVIDSLFDCKRIKVGSPESFRVLIRELQALCLNVNIYEYPVRDRKTCARKPIIDLDSPEFNKY
uniref:RNA polymerase beta subunit n=1 Tax=Tetraselmis marina TaxID=41888 RepID=UPI0021ACB624|nr:RNA polymerase beta subunit [Tetraselmis marina]UUA64516.1 RNA polymerase beta subunit [Tetraselmis marina]